MDTKRNTVQRQCILDAVKALNIHATAEQVYAYIHPKHPTISKATVYRNLSQMAESGELLNIGHFDGSTHYDHRCHQHYHFVCDQCGRIVDVEGDVSDLLGRFGSADDLDITSCNITFRGSCRNCQQH